MSFREKYENLFSNPIEREEFESGCLSIGEEFLPDCAKAVLDGKEATEEYFEFLIGEYLEMDTERVMSMKEQLKFTEQTYVTTKVIRARPETRDGVEGYAIRYPDGYQSWCPKVEFERTSRPLSPEDHSLVIFP